MTSGRGLSDEPHYCTVPTCDADVCNDLDHRQPERVESPLPVQQAAQRLRDDLTYGANTSTPAARVDVQTVVDFLLGQVTAPARVQSPGHAFWPVNGHPDDDECTHREDGTDATYCGLPQAAHLPDREPCDRCSDGLAMWMVRCWKGCWHPQCNACAEHTEREAVDV